MAAIYRALLVVFLRPIGEGSAGRFATLESVRRTHDHAYERWHPHLTLIPPFLFESDTTALAGRLDALGDAVAPACATTSPFTLTFGEIGTFKLARYHNIHLRPSDQTALAALHASLCHAARGHVPDKALRTKGFTAHASLGQSYSAADKAKIATAARGVTGLTVAVDRVHLVYKEASAQGPYSIWSELPLAHELDA